MKRIGKLRNLSNIHYGTKEQIHKRNFIQPKPKGLAHAYDITSTIPHDNHTNMRMTLQNR